MTLYLFKVGLEDNIINNNVFTIPDTIGLNMSFARNLHGRARQRLAGPQGSQCSRGTPSAVSAGLGERRKPLKTGSPTFLQQAKQGAWWACGP